MADFVDPIVTAEIVAAKDKLVIQADRAEVIVDEWESTGNLVKDAPADGKTYGRNNNTWVETTGGGGSGDMTKAVYDPQGIDADAFDRTNQTGTQAISTVTDLQTTLDEKLDDATGITSLRQGETWFVKTAGQSKGIPLLNVATDTVSGLMGTADRTKLDGIESGSQVNKFDYTDAPIDSKTYGRKGGSWVEVTSGGASTWGSITGKLSDQTDLQQALDTKIEGVDLSAATTTTQVTISNTKGNNAIIPLATTAKAGVMGSADRVKLNSIATGAEVNVQSDWNATTGDSFIANKPTLGTMSSVNDAPSDGSQYARKDGTWEVVQGGGGGSIPLIKQPSLLVMGIYTYVEGAQVIFNPAKFGSGQSIMDELIVRGHAPTGQVWNSDLNIQELKVYGNNIQPSAVGDATSFPSSFTGSSAVTELLISRGNRGNYVAGFLECRGLKGSAAGQVWRRENALTTTGTWVQVV